jgi:hypothetical protein
MSCVNYNLLKDGFILNPITTVSGVMLMDAEAIASLYDGDYLTPAYTLSGTPQTVHIQQEFGETFDLCYVLYYTDETSTSNVTMTYKTVEGATYPLTVFQESAGVLRADIDADVNFFNLSHTVSGTLAEAYQLEIYGRKNETLGFGTPEQQLDYYRANNSTSYVPSAATNVIPVFNDSPYNDIAKVSVAPTLTDVDNYLFLAVSGTGPFYGINDYGFSQPGTNPIALHDDSLLGTTVDPQWVVRTPAQRHQVTPTEEGLVINLAYNFAFGGTATRLATGIYSKDAFTAQSFTAEVQVRYLDIDNSGFDNSVRNFIFVLTNTFPIPDIGYHNCWLTDRRRGSSVAGIRVVSDSFSAPTASTLRYNLRWVDGSVNTNPDTYGSLGSATPEYRFVPDLFLIDPEGETGSSAGPTISELEDIRFDGEDYGDFTDTAKWHSWRLVYDHRKTQISAYVDNVHLGDRVMKIEPFGEECRLFIGVEGHGGLKMALRDFKIYPNKVYSQYKVSSSKLGSTASATISGSEAYKVIDDSTSTRYVGPEPTANSHVRIDFPEPSNVVRYRLKQRDQASSLSAYGTTYYPDVAIQAFVDFGGAYYQAHHYEVTSDYVERTPTFSGSNTVVASGINYIDFQFIEYDRTSQPNGALIIDELEVYAEKYTEHEAPVEADDRNRPWSYGRWNNLRQYGTSGGLAIKHRNSLLPAYYPYPEYFLQNVDYGVSSAINGRQLGDSANEYHHAGSLFSSPGTTEAGAYRQWHSANQTNNHIYIWRYFSEMSDVRAVWWDSNTLNKAHVADKFKFQYLSEDGDPNTEADWIDIPPVKIPHPYTGGTSNADTNYKNYKNYLIANLDGSYYTNYYSIPTYGTGFTIASTGSLVSYPRDLIVPEGYVDSSVAVGHSSSFPHTNGLTGYVEFDRDYRTRGIRMVIYRTFESGNTGTAGTLRTSFALDDLYIFRTNGAGSYTSPVFDTGTPQNTERLKSSIREYSGSSHNVYVRSHSLPPAYLYDDTYEIWSNCGSAGTVSSSQGTIRTTDRVISYNGLIYHLRESSARAYNPLLDTWGSTISYPQSGGSPLNTFDEPTDEAEDVAEPASLPLVPDDRVWNNCGMMGSKLYVACRASGDVRTPRMMYYDFSLAEPEWITIKENRPPFTEKAFMVVYEPENRLYFFCEDGTVSYFEISNGNWIVEDAIMPTLGSTRSAMASLLFEDKVYIFGGVIGGNGITDCHVFDMKTKQFSTIASAPYRMMETHAVLVPEHRVVYIIPVDDLGIASYYAIMKYDIDNDSWTTVESLMWFRDSVNLQGPAPAYAYYHDGYLYQNTNNEGISKAKVLRTDWEPGRFPDLRDPVWGGQLGVQFPWIKLDSFGEIMPQQRYFQFRIELYSDDRSTSSVIEDVTVVTPQDLFVPASGTSNLYLKVGVSPGSQYEAWYSADRVGEAPGTNPLSLTGDYSILFTQSSTGRSWGIAATTSGAWDPANDSTTTQRVGVHSPWVLKDAPNSYRMWFTNDYTGTSTGSYGCHIHHAQATSPSSLFNDTRVISEGVISQASTGVKHPCVIKLSPTSYKIWYAGSDASGVHRILSASSVNGTTWTGHAVSLNVSSSVWDVSGAYKPCVLLEDGVYRMWYTGLDVEGVERILYTTSTDGSTWDHPRIAIDVAAEGELDYDGSFNAFVLKDGIQYICYYIGRQGSNKSVIYATSPDGLEWFNFQIVIPPGGLVEAIDGNGVIDMFVVLNRDVVVPGSMISGAQIKLYNNGAAI